MNSNLPEWLMASLWRAMLGEIYPSIRAIAVELSKEKKLRILAYLDREPTEFDEDAFEVIAMNLSASLDLNQVSNISLEFQCSTIPVGKLDMLDGCIYARREYDM